jgi:circadian clock protein KaiB
MTLPRDVALDVGDDGLAAPDPARHVLTLFVSGASDLSGRAISNARRLCDLHLYGRYQLSVIDVHEDPAAALDSQVLATPTLIRNRPLPVRRLVGDLSHADTALLALQLPVAIDPPRA